MVEMSHNHCFSANSSVPLMSSSSSGLDPSASVHAPMLSNSPSLAAVVALDAIPEEVPGTTSSATPTLAPSPHRSSTRPTPNRRALLWLGAVHLLLGLTLLTLNALFDPLIASHLSVSAALMASLCAVIALIAARSHFPDRPSQLLLFACSLVCVFLWCALFLENAHSLASLPSSPPVCPPLHSLNSSALMLHDDAPLVRFMPCLGTVFLSLNVCLALIGVFLSACILLLSLRQSSSRPIPFSAIRHPFSALIDCRRCGGRRCKAKTLPPVLKRNGHTTMVMHQQNGPVPRFREGDPSGTMMITMEDVGYKQNGVFIPHTTST